MPEYIEREAIKKFIEDGLNNPNKAECFGHDAVEILAEIEFLPAADVVPVVRCKECAHLLQDNSKSACHLCMRRQLFPQEVNLDDFCSFGERWNDNA